MSDASDRETARSELVALLQPSASPVLSDAGDGNDIDTILDNHMLASTWAAETDYTAGTLVLPVTRNGHRYRCIQGGTSGSEEPEIWPTGQGTRVADGEGSPRLVWVEDGPGPGNVYDVRGAAHEAWLLRATRSAGKFDISLGGQRFNRSQVYEHCMRMAASFAPVSFG